MPAIIEEIMEPMGVAHVNGSNRIPAPIGEVPLTIWNLCGIEKIATLKGAPRKNALLKAVSIDAVSL